MSNTKFISNEDGHTLQERFASRIKNTQFFDVLVGYFYSSGFKAIYPSLENTEKIRILIGISTDYKTFKAVQSAKMSHKEVGDSFSELVKDELDESEDNIDVEESIAKFKEWLESKKIEIRAYPDEKIHSKIYIMTADEKTRSFTKGSVITGSSNFTESGLRGNIEFNVELKDEADYDYALEKFEELWEKGVDLSERYVQTINQETWLKDNVTPYELYLKFLYEYFKSDINDEEDFSNLFRPKNFKPLEYQEHAVITAKRILNEYNGVFLSDVVGLGKTYMGTMLCQILRVPTLVIAPPHLIAKENPGSWRNAFSSFNIDTYYECESKGKIDQLAARDDLHRFRVVLIDEAHNYRNEDTQTYTYLNTICKNKKVILVTATPYNNSPNDLLSQIKLFQASRNSNIPNLTNIEFFFNQLKKNLKGISKTEQPDEYLEQVKRNARLIRERLLKYIMVRRTREEIKTYYGKDLESKNMSFPKIKDPQPIFYQFDSLENTTFDNTLTLLASDFNYARYRPLDYLKDQKKLSALDKTRQKNITKFMKILVIKRLESSYYAFSKTMERLIKSYEHFIDQYHSGTIYISKKHFQKIMDLLEKGDLEAVDDLVEKGDIEKYEAKEFEDYFIDDLNKDLLNCKKILKEWNKIKSDSKLNTFKELINKDKVFKKNKYIIFTESKDTSDYLKESLAPLLNNRVINFSGDNTSQDERKKVLNNFDNNSNERRDDYDVLITTDVLAEGVSLHRCNTVINYDIPWNPTKIMQRVGRINRVDSPHDTLFTYNFFPTEKGNNEIGLKENAEAKIKAFISLLGTDAKLLTDDEEVEAHSLFEFLNSQQAVGGEDVGEVSELGYLKEIRAIRDEDSDLFLKIKKMPRKCRAARNSENKGLLTFLRRGSLKRFYFSEINKDTIEKDFIEAAQLLKAEVNEKSGKFSPDYYELLASNKRKLDSAIDESNEEVGKKTGGKNVLNDLRNLLSVKEIKNYHGYVEHQEKYLKDLIKEINNGSLVKGKAKEALNACEPLRKDPIKFINRLKDIIPEDIFTKEKKSLDDNLTKKEVILSEYFS